MLFLLVAAAAQAAPVLVMGHNGKVRRENDRFISAAQSVSPAPAPVASAAAQAPSPGSGQNVSSALKRRPAAKKPKVSVPSTLAKLAKAKQITAAQQRSYLSQWNATLAEIKHLSSARAAQLRTVAQMIYGMAVRDELTASRLPVLFLTLARNAQWWKSGSMLAYGARVMFAGSNIEWEYYTGEGIQLQVLGTFGEANGFYESGKSSWPKLESLVNEMIPLAVQRGGGLAWEYYFDWEGGSPPWVSAMSQATAIEALTNAYLASKNKQYLQDAHSALGILQTPPPTGVAETTAKGRRFLQYSFAPHTDIINAFLQTLIGLDDYATVSKDPLAQQLFMQGNAQASAELPSFNTGGWSLYQPGEADDLSYHQLVTGFLQTLCDQTKTPVYCSTYTDFEKDLTTPPKITQVTQKGKKNTQFRLYFKLDKPAHVGVIVSDAKGHDYLYTSSNCEPGNDYWIVPKLKAGTYTVKLSGTDLAGNYASTTGTLKVS